MLGSQGSHCHEKIKSGVVDSSEGVGRKRRVLSSTDRYRVGILCSTEIGRSGGRIFLGTVTVGNGYNHQGQETGAEYFESARKKEKAAHEGDLM